MCFGIYNRTVQKFGRVAVKTNRNELLIYELDGISETTIRSTITILIFDNTQREMGSKKSDIFFVRATCEKSQKKEQNLIYHSSGGGGR